MTSATAIRDALRCGVLGCECSRGGKVHCPAHDDQHPSLDVDEKVGRTLVICRAGCSQGDVLAALRASGLWDGGERDEPRSWSCGQHAAAWKAITTARAGCADCKPLCEAHGAKLTAIAAEEGGCSACRAIPRPTPLRVFLSDHSGERRADVVAPLADAGITFIMAPPGSGKSLLALELAITKAAGVSAIGLTATAGRVLFVGADMSPDDYAGYIGMVLQGRDLALENLDVVCTHAIAFDGDERMLREIVIESDPELIVFDHFEHFMNGDSTRQHDLRPAIQLLAKIRDLGIAIVMVDQTRKQPDAPNKGVVAPALDRLYGGRAKSAIADRIVLIQKDEGSGVFTVTAAKERGAGFAPLTLAFDEDSGWSRLDAPPRRRTPSEDAVLAALDSAADGVRTRAEIETRTSLVERSVQKALRALIRYGEIEKCGQRGRADLFRRRVQFTLVGHEPRDGDRDAMGEREGATPETDSNAAGVNMGEREGEMHDTGMGAHVTPFIRKGAQHSPFATNDNDADLADESRAEQIDDEHCVECGVGVERYDDIGTPFCEKHFATAFMNYDDDATISEAHDTIDETPDGTHDGTSRATVIATRRWNGARP